MLLRLAKQEFIERPEPSRLLKKSLALGISV
jgi:hypothetical protein